jgi:hypothetical protein
MYSARNYAVLIIIICIIFIIIDIIIIIDDGGSGVEISSELLLCQNTRSQRYQFVIGN